MSHRERKILLTVICSIMVATVSCSNPNGGEPAAGNEPRMYDSLDKSAIGAESPIENSKGSFISVKYCPDENGECEDLYFDAKTGKEVTYEEVFVPTVNSPYTDDLKDKLEAPGADSSEEVVEIEIEFHEKKIELKDAPQTSMEDGPDGLKYFVDGQEVSQAEYEAAEAKKENAVFEKVEARLADRKKSLDELLKREKDLVKLSDTYYEKYTKGEVEELKFDIKLKEVKGLYERNRDLIKFISLPAEGVKASLTSAMNEAGITAQQRKRSDFTGRGIGVLAAEPYCTDYSYRRSHAPVGESPVQDRQNYTVLGESICRDLHSQNVTTILSTVAPASHIFCKPNSKYPTSADIRRTENAIRVINGSFYYRNTNKYYSNNDKRWDDYVYDNNVFVAIAAGNEGLKDGYVTSPGKALNVLTVGNYIDGSSRLNTTSSYLNPKNTKNEKPEIVAPGTNINAGYYYDVVYNRLREIVMTGTSQASPIVAGAAADFLSIRPQLKFQPQLIKALMIAAAVNKVSDNKPKTSKDLRSGYGGLNVDKLLGNEFWWHWWNGSDSTWDRWARNDAEPNNGMIDKVYYINKGDDVRAVISWLNRGEWTYDHRDDVHPIGMDLDLSVYNPNGRLIEASRSFDNGFEVVDFKATQSGNYRFEINKYSKRDKNARIKLGFAISIR